MDIIKMLPKEFDQEIFNYWISSRTNEEISCLTNKDKFQIEDQVAKFTNIKNYPDEIIDFAFFDQSRTGNDLDDEFVYPIFNVWQYEESKNEESFYEKRILSNLLYLYSQPFDVIIDPFAGKGSTIDVCKNRLRRFWVSDRKLYGPRMNQLRESDILKNMPLIEDWNSVSVTFLDPPYWAQAAGKYSNDREDLGNMTLENFTRSIVEIVQNFASFQRKGVIALTMRATQESNSNRHYIDHAMQIINNVKSQYLELENRISCPYSINRYPSSKVEWSKLNRKLYVNNREIIVWRVCSKDKQ